MFLRSGSRRGTTAVKKGWDQTFEHVRLLAQEDGQLVLTAEQLARAYRSATHLFSGSETQGGVHADCIPSRPLGDLTFQVLVVAPAMMGACRARRGWDRQHPR